MTCINSTVSVVTLNVNELKGRDCQAELKNKNMI